MNFPVSKKFLCYIFFLPYKTIQARQILRSHHVHHIVRTKVHLCSISFPFLADNLYFHQHYDHRNSYNSSAYQHSHLV